SRYSQALVNGGQHEWHHPRPAAVPPRVRCLGGRGRARARRQRLLRSPRRRHAFQAGCSRQGGHGRRGRDDAGPAGFGRGCGRPPAHAQLAQLPARHAALTRRLRALLRRLRGQPAPIPEAVWDAAVRQGPWLSALPATRQARLRGLASAFLGRKTITPLGGLELDDAERCLLAALCCLPLLEFGEEGLHGWSQLLVYPEAFRVQRSHVDASGVLHEWHDELIGEAWESGPLVLSWADVQADCEDPRAGFCVAAHEMAHKLDALDGVLDGTPPLAAPVAAAVGA